jgi:hypothetical protein
MDGYFRVILSGVEVEALVHVQICRVDRSLYTRWNLSVCIEDSWDNNRETSSSDTSLKIARPFGGEGRNSISIESNKKLSNENTLSLSSACKVGLK